MVPLPRLPANALTSSLAGGDRLDARSRKTIRADGPAPDGGGIGGGASTATGGSPAAAGRGGGPAGNAGDTPATVVPGGLLGAVPGATSDPGATGGFAAAAAAAGAPDVSAAGASSGALCTGLRGAGNGADAPEDAPECALGGAVTAGIEALATGVPAGVPPVVPAGGPAEPEDPAEAVAPASGGGGAVPTPNRVGEALGEDGSASGADSAACCALVRSAINELVSWSSAFWSTGAGFAGTVARLG